MGYFTDSLKALGTTFKQIFRKPATYEFPAVIRPRAERLRASFALPDDENGELACIACMACEKICPSQIIHIKSEGKRESPVTGKKRQYADKFILDLNACIGCELCIQVCNSDAIVMVREQEIPAFDREDLVLDLEKLRANAKAKKAAWGKGTVLQGMQEPPKPPKAEKAEGDAKPAAAKPAAAKPAPAAKPAEAKPEGEAKAGAKPAEAKADAKPAEAKAEPKPEAKADGDAKPEARADAPKPEAAADKESPAKEASAS
jgi:formate hydrogenlyase subunit 6/NADH:ubiquinone oxidoreductase subunit I